MHLCLHTHWCTEICPAQMAIVEMGHRTVVEIIKIVIFLRVFGIFTLSQGIVMKILVLPSLTCSMSIVLITHEVFKSNL